MFRFFRATCCDCGLTCETRHWSSRLATTFRSLLLALLRTFAASAGTRCRGAGDHSYTVVRCCALATSRVGDSVFACTPSCLATTTRSVHSPTSPKVKTPPARVARTPPSPYQSAHSPFVVLSLRIPSGCPNISSHRCAAESERCRVRQRGRLPTAQVPVPTRLASPPGKGALSIPGSRPSSLPDLIRSDLNG